MISPNIGPAKNKETNGAQFITIATTVKVKYFVAITTIKIPKFPEIIRETKGGTDPLSTES